MCGGSPPPHHTSVSSAQTSCWIRDLKDAERPLHSPGTTPFYVIRKGTHADFHPASSATNAQPRALKVLTRGAVALERGGTCAHAQWWVPPAAGHAAQHHGQRETAPLAHRLAPGRCPPPTRDVLYHLHTKLHPGWPPRSLHSPKRPARCLLPWHASPPLSRAGGEGRAPLLLVHTCAQPPARGGRPARKRVRVNG